MARYNSTIKNEIRILLIEDNPGDANLLEKQLEIIEGTQYNIHLAETLSAGIKALEDNSFDIVLTDLSLPDSNGFETIEGILEVNKTVPLIVLSGQEDEEFSIKAVQLGAQDYLTKGLGDGHLISRAIRYSIERKRAEQGMRYLAHYDSLTGLANRTLFRERLDRALIRAKRSQSQVAILYIDLDRFKQINDTLGHEVGDDILVDISKRLTTCIRQDDTVARLGGDEFMLMLENINSQNDAALIAKKIIDVLVKPCMANGRELFITPSIGITIFPNDHMEANELLKNADAAMYRAKEKGRNRFQFYTEGMNQDSLQRMDMEASLRRALDNNEFVLHYQPKFDIKTQALTGAEALIRWNHPKMGMVPPFDFIPLAEETGLIVPIGEWVIKEACRNMQTWKLQGYDPIRIAVNLSPRQFYQSEIVDMILDCLIEHEVKPNEFEVEITEGLLMEDTETTISLLNKLKVWGLHISIDDFGTGYCSLGYLKNFPIDTLKIDRSFVKDIMTEPDDAAITQAIIALAHTLRLSVTAEGIETEDQLKFLKQHNCNEGQGYLYSKPIPAEELTQIINKRGDEKPSNRTIQPIKKSA